MCVGVVFVNALANTFYSITTYQLVTSCFKTGFRKMITIPVESRKRMQQICSLNFLFNNCNITQKHSGECLSSLFLLVWATPSSIYVQNMNRTNLCKPFFMHHIVLNICIVAATMTYERDCMLLWHLDIKRYIWQTFHNIQTLSSLQFIANTVSIQSALMKAVQRYKSFEREY